MLTRVTYILQSVIYMVDQYVLCSKEKDGSKVNQLIQFNMIFILCITTT